MNRIVVGGLLTFLMSGTAWAQDTCCRNYEEFAARCRSQGGQPSPNPPTCRPLSGGGGDNGAAARETERLEQERLGKDAFEKGQAALRAGDVRSALAFYRTALLHAPDNVLYRRQRASTLRAYPGSALEQLREAEMHGEATVATPGDAVSLAGRQPFDRGAKPAPGAAFADDNVPMVLGRMLDLPLDLRDPANADVRAAMTEVVKVMAHNRQVRISEAGSEDVPKFEKAVTDLNKTLAARGVAEVPVEKVEAVYRKHLLDVKEKKQ